MMGPKHKPSRIDQEIERNLRRAFDDVAEQELPSRFTDLLQQLRAQETQVRASEETDE
ncbi:MAG: NepR family anti-sigma factor [Pseudomonadota bacterium]